MPARRDIMTGRLNFLEKPWGGIEPFDQTLAGLLKTKNVFTHMVTDHYLYLYQGGENYWNDFTSSEIVRGQEFDPLHMPACKEGVVTQRHPEGYKGIYSRETRGKFQMLCQRGGISQPGHDDQGGDWLEHNADADNFSFGWRALTP